MKLHGNAALSWSGRRRLAERVVVEGWSVKATAEAAGVSVRCARKWIGRFGSKESAGLGKLSRIGLEQPMRYEPAVPVSSCMSTSSDSAGSRAAPARAVTPRRAGLRAASGRRRQGRRRPADRPHPRSAGARPLPRRARAVPCRDWE